MRWMTKPPVQMGVTKCMFLASECFPGGYKTGVRDERRKAYFRQVWLMDGDCGGACFGSRWAAGGSQEIVGQGALWQMVSTEGGGEGDARENPEPAPVVSNPPHS